MPVYDTPINTDADGLPRLLNAGLPVLLYLYDGASTDAADMMLREAAEDFAGDILVARVDAAANPSVAADYDSPRLPAVVTLDDGEVESKAGRVGPTDIDDHVMFLVGQGPQPGKTAAERAAEAADGTAPIHTSTATFQQDVLQSDVPVLVDFWAPWCGPCHVVAPVLDEIAKDYAGRVVIAKLNVDENQQIAATYRAMSIPMLLMFKGGEQVGGLVGAHPRPNIEQMVQAAL